MSAAILAVAGGGAAYLFAQHYRDNPPPVGHTGGTGDMVGPVGSVPVSATMTVRGKTMINAAGIGLTTGVQSTFTSPASYAGVSSGKMSAEENAKAAALQAAAKEVYLKADAAAKKKAVDWLNKEYKLDPKLTYEDGWDKIVAVCSAQVLASAAGAALGAMFGPLGAKVGALVGAFLGEKLANLLNKAWPEIKEWLTGKWDFLKDKLAGYWNSIEDFAGEAVDWAEDKIDDAVDWLGGLI